MMAQFSDEFLESWDNLHAAIDRILTARPDQMTFASENLEESRRLIREEFNAELRRLLPNSPSTPQGERRE